MIIIIIFYNGFTLSRAVVTVQVTAVDKYAPKFENTSYTVDLQEGIMSENIIKVRLHDDDEAPENSGICSYEILSQDVPFKLTSEGMCSQSGRTV